MFNKQFGEDQNIYIKAFGIALGLYELVRKFPGGSSTSLSERIIESSSAVCSYIAEAWQNLDSLEMFISELNNAAVEASEIQGRIDAAIKCGCLGEHEGRELNDAYAHIIEEIAEMIREPGPYLLSTGEIIDDARVFDGTPTLNAHTDQIL